MFLSFFSSLDYPAIGKIIAADVMLGVDNAIVIALACAGIRPALRKRAMFVGTAGAILLRAVLLACAGWLMTIPYLKLVAGAYLLVIGVKLLTSSDDAHGNVQSSDNFAGAIKTIIIADLMMSIDNVFAVVGAADSTGAHSTVYAIAGIVLSIPIILFGATAIMQLMERFPIIVWIGAGMMGWIGAEMILTEPVLAPYLKGLLSGEHVHLTVRIGGFLLVLAAAAVLKWRGKPVAEVAA
ncbi:TerC family protein [Jeongeupia wiesaeckerbachi]|uniref:TerC family protein n=1 Tax=Jeongeupia wiesaeckerbachi TaxID=3051218 RepID=UPI003D80059E